jgi:hypothetical protein
MTIAAITAVATAVGAETAAAIAAAVVVEVEAVTAGAEAVVAAVGAAGAAIKFDPDVCANMSARRDYSVLAGLFDSNQHWVESALDLTEAS